MKKALRLLLITTLICCTLTGCVTDKIISTGQNLMQGLQTSSFKDTLAKDRTIPQEKSTKKAGDKAAKMNDKASYWDQVDSQTNWIFSMPPVIKKLITTSMKKKRTTDAVNAMDKYETAKATDETFLKARESMGITGSITNIKWSKFGWLLGVLLLIGLIFLFRMLKRKKIENKNLKRESKAKAKAIKRGDAEIVVQESPEQFDSGYTDASETQAKLSARSDEKSAAACRKYCDKYGIDYETYLAQYNGDNKALLDFLISSSKEDFQ